jgi:ElaB/YqjD/DUF883 family membrane-anchored ribosome-binding protein
MSTEQTSGRPTGSVADVKDKGADIVASAQAQVSTKAHELGEEASVQIREQVQQRSNQIGGQMQSVGKTLRSSANQLRSEGKDIPAKVVEEVARRADELGGYFQSAQAERILDDVERFVRRRPWLAAGTGLVAGFVASRFLKASGERRYEGTQGNGHYAHSAPPQPSLTSGGA